MEVSCCPFLCILSSYDDDDVAICSATPRKVSRWGIVNLPCRVFVANLFSLLHPSRKNLILLMVFICRSTFFNPFQNRETWKASIANHVFCRLLNHLCSPNRSCVQNFKNRDLVGAFLSLTQHAPIFFYQFYAILSALFPSRMFGPWVTYWFAHVRQPKG